MRTIIYVLCKIVLDLAHSSNRATVLRKELLEVENYIDSYEDTADD